ncbi:MAG: hypothetical protein JW384_02787 [Nitrosomonadaceae bacterium]|nr:hypothetical protein [Nitrosomonadaceae bacterium]
MTQSLVPANEYHPVTDQYLTILNSKPWEVGLPEIPLPSPMDIDNQLFALAQSPRDIKTLRGFDYLSIGYVQMEMNNIFGMGNWHVRSQPGYPNFKEDESAKGETYIRILDKVWLVLIYANGSQQVVEGYGEGAFRPTNAQASTAASLEIARTEAFKAAAKRIAPAFGMGLRDLMEGGLADDIEAAGASNAIQNILDAKNRIFSPKGAEDRILDDEALDVVSEFCAKVSYASAGDKAKRVILSMVEKLPTITERLERIEILRISNIDVTDDASIGEIKVLEAQLKKKGVK